MAQWVKSLPAMFETQERDAGSIPGSGRSPGEGNGNLPQYSCLENPTDRGAWWATVHGAAKSWTRLSDTINHLGLGRQNKRSQGLLVTNIIMSSTEGLH